MKLYHVIKLYYRLKERARVGTGMSRARNSRWGMLLHVAGIYGGQNKIGVHVYHVDIAIYIYDNLSKWHIDCHFEENPSYT